MSGLQVSNANGLQGRRPISMAEGRSPWPKANLTVSNANGLQGRRPVSQRSGLQAKRSPSEAFFSCLTVESTIKNSKLIIKNCGEPPRAGLQVSLRTVSQAKGRSPIKNSKFTIKNCGGAPAGRSPREPRERSLIKNSKFTIKNWSAATKRYCKIYN